MTRFSIWSNLDKVKQSDPKNARFTEFTVFFSLGSCPKLALASTQVMVFFACVFTSTWRKFSQVPTASTNDPKSHAVIFTEGFPFSKDFSGL